MKRMKGLLLVAAITYAMPVHADWIPYASRDGSTFYADTNTVRSIGKFRRVWALRNLSVPTEDGIQSRRTLIEFDCKQEAYRNLSLTRFKGPMASGEIAESINVPGEWKYVPPQTHLQLLLAVVCTV
jgi:hypothetical protein